jgi:ribosomal protein S18 acetylase RimI-like enzyme
MSKVGIRRFNEGDIPRLMVLAEEFMPGEATYEERLAVLKNSLKSSHYELWVAEVDNEISGFIDLWIIPDFCHGGNLGYIQNLYVAQKYRRMGIGSKLFKKIIERAKERDALEIHVVTKFDNEPAIRLYKKHGLTKESLQLEMEFE